MSENKPGPVSKNKPGPFSKIPAVIVLEIAKYLNNPFKLLGLPNHFARDSLAIYPVKSIFMKSFPDIPELITEDVDKCEPELRIILPLAKFTNPAHLNEALKYEFIHGNRLNTLLPNLIKYFDRVGTIESNRSVINSLMERKRFDILFQNEAFFFHKYVKVILDSKYLVELSRFKGLFEYIIENPQHFDHIKNAITNYFLSFMISWNKLVLISNAPDSFLINFPQMLIDTFDQEPSIWSGIVIPKELYQKIFERINNLTKSSKIVYKHYNLLNRIRFGPDESESLENEIQDMTRFSDSKQFQLLEFASLANKMDLLDKMLRKITFSFKKRYCRHKVPSSKDPIELLKVFFDIHNSKFYTGFDDSLLLSKISKKYKVTSIQYSNTGLEVELTISTAPNKNYPVPEIMKIYPSYYWKSIEYTLNDLEFENAYVLERFLPDCLEILKSERKSGVFINAENLKIIAQSESICHLLRTILAEFPKDHPRPVFVTDIVLLPNVLNEPVLSLADIVDIVYRNDTDTAPIVYLHAPTQLKRLETLTGQSISSFVKPEKIENYFAYHHVFKYLIQTGQGIPQGINESILELLRIDFPKYFAKSDTKEN